MSNILSYATHARRPSVLVALATLRPCCTRSTTLVSIKCIAVRKVATPLRELTCHMGSPGRGLTFPPLPQPKLVLD